MKSSTPELLKFRRLQRTLHESRRGTIGLLEGMWLEVAKNCPQGDIGRFTNEEIAIMTDWEGDPDTLVDALVECQWLDRCDSHRLVVHDWAEHCPTYIRGNLASHGKHFAKATRNEQAAKQSAIASCSEGTTTKPSLTKPNQAKPSQAQDSSELDEPAAEPATDVVLQFPCNGQPKTWTLTEWQVAKWSELYPGLDVLGECRKALAWVLATTKRRKTSGGMSRFLVGWLNRANDRAGPSTQPDRGAAKSEASRKVHERLQAMARQESGGSSE